MSLVNLGGSFAELIPDVAQYHKAAFAEGKLWLFGLKYVEQPTHNWGHRVHLAGSYAIAFDVASKKWQQPVNVPPLSAEENIEECFFTSGNAIYLLLHSAFDGPAFFSLHKWTDSQWSKVADLSMSSDSVEGRMSYAMVDTASTSEKYILTNGAGGSMKIFSLNLEKGSMEHFTDVSRDDNPLNGRPLFGCVEKGKLLISYGVHGCGFRWESRRFIRVDLGTKKVEHFMLQGSDDLPKEGPRFGYSGSSMTALNKSGGWMHITGTIQVGMSGSQFDGSVWVLEDPTGEAPKWSKLGVEVPSEYGESEFLSAYDVTSGDLYMASRNHVASLTL